MNGVTAAAILLVATAALLARVGERLVDWLISPQLNYRIGAASARLAVRLARSERERHEAEDVLGNILASAPESSDVSPLASVAPVLTRCLAAQFRRLGNPWKRNERQAPEALAGYKHTNSKGVTYHLNSKRVTLVGGEVQAIYYFSKDHRPATATLLPSDRTVRENPRNGFLTSRRMGAVGPATSPRDTTRPVPGSISSAPLRPALRSATRFPLRESWITSCLDDVAAGDEVFEHARAVGLDGLKRSQRSGHLSRVTGAVAESVAEITLAEFGHTVFWHITTPGVQGVDLLFLSPDESVLALEVKGTLRAGSIPRLTPSPRRQMSRDWLDDPRNPAMTEWTFVADDLYAGVMIVDLATPQYCVAVSGDFEQYFPITMLEQLQSLRWLG